jgi:hypothetical protein
MSSICFCAAKSLILKQILAEAGGVEPHPLLAEPGFQGQSQDHPRCINLHVYYYSTLMLNVKH